MDEVNKEIDEKENIAKEENVENDINIEEENVENSENHDESNENKEIEKLRDSLQRLQADFTNYRNRQEKEKKDIYKYASESLITKLLSVIDNLERALKEVQEESPFTKGIELVRDDLMNILKNEGLEMIDSDGQLFDANLHHAVFMEESKEVESEHIIETFQKGYTLNSKVIRPAMVKVSK